MDLRAEKARTTAILHMAFDFASMARTFKKGTKDKFLRRVRAMLPRLAHVESEDEFDTLHAEVCRWGCRSFRPSHAGRPRASYGQVAKTLNVVLKVVVYYCGLTRPTPGEAPVTLASPCHRQLHDEVPPAAVQGRVPPGIQAIADVDRRSYTVLINLAARDAVENLGGKLHPVQWEDIVWSEVNGKR